MATKKNTGPRVTKQQLAAFKRDVEDLTGSDWSKIEKFKLREGTEFPGGYILLNSPAGILWYTGEYEEDDRKVSWIPDVCFHGDYDCWAVGLH